MISSVAIHKRIITTASVLLYAASGCLVRIVNIDDNTAFYPSLSYEKTIEFFEVTPGTYRAEVFGFMENDWCAGPTPDTVEILSGSQNTLCIKRNYEPDRSSGRTVNVSDTSGYGGTVSYPSENTLRYEWEAGGGHSAGYQEIGLPDAYIIEIQIVDAGSYAIPLLEGTTPWPIASIPEFVAAPTATEPSTAPNVWWSLDETSGTREDLAGSLDLPGSGIGYSAGKVSNAASVDDENYLSRSSGTVPVSNDFTWCGWIKDTNLSPDEGWCLMLQSGGNSYLKIWYQSSYSGWKVVLSDGVQYAGPYTLDFGYTQMPVQNQWYFWALTVKDAVGVPDMLEGTLWLNNRPVASGRLNKLPYFGGLYSPASISVGYGQQNGRLFDEIARFPAALSANELLWLYNDGNGRAFSEL